MEAKTLVAMILVVLAVLVAYTILAPQPAPPSREEVEMEEFADYLQQAPDVYIIMDARGAESTVVKKNINQCGADLAGSRGLVGKTLHIFALNESACFAVDGTLPLESCLSEFNRARSTFGTALFYVQSGDQPTIYENELIIGINESYSYMDCNVEVSQPPSAYDETPIPENETVEEPYFPEGNETGMNETTGNETG